ncbi:MAG: hypothetical protein AB7T38_05830 [Nitrospirales bacterium]
MDSIDDWTNLLEQTEIKLKRLLGLAEFKVKAYDGEEVVGIDGYFQKGYPSCALEVIEQFYEELAGFEEAGEEKALRFQTEINEAMTTFQCPWLLSKGQFFQIDAVFFNEEIIQKSEDLLSEQGFKGAHDEFREAREDLSDGKTKDVILKAFKSFESTLKIVLGKPTGDITELLRQFREEGYLDDIPEPKRKALVNKVLSSIAVLRNELSGHGQGEEVLNVPRPYAVLGLHLAGSLNQFVMEQWTKKKLMQG